MDFCHDPQQNFTQTMTKDAATLSWLYENTFVFQIA